ncbi:ATP-grasp domain-containing protein [Zobellia russellii]|uniref:ATP-grasp domain-containing protein n=1 Tax=Zobellia russellii TaxID=248907 RepID=UPI00293D3012|nr:ATP-grasp domain-containing protein [Zobellia russellii]
MKKIAILYQAKLPPIKDGVQKPMKLGGYSDSGADIACELYKNGVEIVTPVHRPNIETDLDWVFPDTKEGIQKALDKGANTFWLNTVLYKDHDVTHFFSRDIKFVGQLPEEVDMYDDKFFTNEILRKNNIAIPKTQLISSENLTDYSLEMDFPLVVKPLRGRGSQGVSLVKDPKELDLKLNEIFSDEEYGKLVYVEEFLNGQEITVTVMPQGTYTINDQEVNYKNPWCLPAVKRFNHKDGIAPYNGTVAVMTNSSVLEEDELNSKEIKRAYEQCVKAGELLNIKAPIRIDCRADIKGNYFLFDLNMKPNMTGPSRPSRQNQDSLTLLAARKIGWSYIDLLRNMLKQAWKPHNRL